MSDNVSSAANQQERLLVKLNTNYVIGLVDGEGYFSVSARYGKQKNWLLKDVKFMFGIKLRADDGKIILNAVRKFFDCGSVYFRKDTRKNFCNCYEFQVGTHKEIFNKIIPFFQKNQLLFPSRRKTFKRFCKIAEMVQRKEHIRKGGIEKIQKLAKELH